MQIEFPDPVPKSDKMSYFTSKGDYTFFVASTMRFNTMVYVTKFDLLIIGCVDSDTGYSNLILVTVKTKCQKIYRNIHEKCITAIVFDEHTNILYTASRDKTIKLFQVSEKPGIKYLRSIIDHKDWITALVLVKEYSLLLSAGLEPNINIWHMEQKKRVGKIATTTGCMGSLVYIEKEKLVGVSFYYQIKLYSLFKKELVFEIRPGTQILSDLYYLKRKNLIVAVVSHGDYIAVKKWQYRPQENEKLIAEAVIPSTISVLNQRIAATIDEEEKYLFFTSYRPSVQVVDLEVRKTLSLPTKQHNATCGIIYIPGKNELHVGDYRKNLMGTIFLNK